MPPLAARGHYGGTVEQGLVVPKDKSKTTANELEWRLSWNGG